jgi:pimeloyl-ACP methyl ester carboxylesterase
MNTRAIETRRGIKCRVLEAGSGRPVVFLHGAGGLFEREPFLERLAAKRRVLAVEWPGYGESTGEEKLEDMLDFALHGWDVIDALALDERPVLIGHSMGGMIAAEMACLNPRAIEKLVLVSAAGLWIDSQPIADLFATTPFELPQLLFHDPQEGIKLLMGGLDLSDDSALQKFLIDNARRLGTAGKILFPIPDRRLSKRIYRLTTPTLVLWGRSERLIPPAYAEHWVELLADAKLAWIEEAGHMLLHEQPDACAEQVERFLS